MKFLIAILALCSAFPALAGELDTAKIESVTGMKGTYNSSEKVFKLSYPRSDLHVQIAGVKANPALGLTAWAAFTKPGNHVMVMGDIVMTEDQVNPVMDAALNHGLEVTALHNHFFYDSPKVMFMHIGGMGDEARLASGVKAVFDTLKATASSPVAFPNVSIDPAHTKFDTHAIDAALGASGKLGGGVYKVTIGRTAQMDGFPMGKEMGVNTWAAFVGTDSQAVVDGDFAMLESELQGVLKALRHAGIYIVAIHNHMTGENPRVLFLHYWGTGAAVDLAKGIKSALDTQGNWQSSRHHHGRAVSGTRR